MRRAFAVVATLMVPTTAFAQGGLGANALPSGTALPPQSPTGPILAPTRKIDPTYPAKARHAGVQGDVWLDLIVLADGTVQSVTVARSVDTVFGLDQAAIAAVRQWQYPPLTDGRASRPPLQVVIPFRLPDATPAAARATVEEFGVGAVRPRPNDPRVVPPKLVQRVPPVYTTAGLRARIAGSVLVDAVVLADGRVGQVRVARSLDKPTGLDDQALGAAREWTFTPGTLDGEPVSMIVSIVLTFSLR
jgi:protein TonB